MFKIIIFTSESEKKKNQELSLLEQYTQPQTEKKQELRAFKQETLRLFIEWGCQTLQGLPSSLTESLLWIIQKGIKKGYCYSAKKTGQSTGKKESAFQVFSQKPTSLSATTGYRHPGTKGVETRFFNNPSLILALLPAAIPFLPCKGTFYILYPYAGKHFQFSIPTNRTVPQTHNIQKEF